MTRAAGKTFGIAILGTVFVIAFSSTAFAADPPVNPWFQTGFLNQAHQGGEAEAPSNTMYAFKTAIADRGADMLELDVNLTSDGKVVVIHNADVGGTTEDGSGLVRNMTLAEVQALDAAYWFHPGTAQYNHTLDSADYIYRGVRTGAVLPPAGYSPDDFRIPLLSEVLDHFPDTPINIEIKVPGNIDAEGIKVAEHLADLLKLPAYKDRTDLIVVSFGQPELVRFHELAPDVDLAASEAALLSWALNQEAPPIEPAPVALQVPPVYNGLDVVGLISERARKNNYAIHTWLDGDEENADFYKTLVDEGVDGIMSAEPGKLAAFLCGYNIRRPDGTKRCPAQPTIVVRHRISIVGEPLAKALKHGLGVKSTCSGTCSVRLKVKAVPGTARKAGLTRRKGKSVVVGSGGFKSLPSGTQIVRIKLKGKARRKLKKLKSAGFKVTAVARSIDGAKSRPAKSSRSLKR